MHYSVLVLVKKPEEPLNGATLRKLVEERLSPWGGDRVGAKWDWWQIGGRWTGLFDGYDPNADPKNIVTCRVCEGTGKRSWWPPNTMPEWIEQCHGCNGCGGTGKTVAWPTQFGTRLEDCKPVAQLTPEELDKFYAVVTDFGWFCGERYEPWAADRKFVKQPLPSLCWLKKEFDGWLAVVVDCHN